MKRKTYLLFVLVILVLMSCKREEQPPNIIYIMSDDHTTGAISAYGESFLETPNIDNLAEQGMRFNNCFNVVSLCGPSRASILTGIYSVHNGYLKNGDRLDTALLTFPKVLQKAGYETAVIGKWHLITQPQGFDFYDVISKQGHYYNCRMKKKGEAWQDGSKGGQQQPGYVTDVITNKAINWLQSRNKTKPFCLLVHHKSPHGPYRYPEEYNSYLADTMLPEPPSFYDKFEGKNQQLAQGFCGYSKLQNIHPLHFIKEIPDSANQGSLSYKRWAYQTVMKGYHRLVRSLDDNVGRLINFIDNSDLHKNTVVIYTSDNGWFLGDHGLFNKMWMYEESLRVPLIVRYHEKIEPSSVSDDFISTLDFAPTILDIAQVFKNEQFQGSSLKSILHGEAPENPRMEHFYHYFGQYEVPSHCGIRTKEYKLVHFYEIEEGPKWELYNLIDDPDEMVNLINDPSYKSKITELKAILRDKKNEYENKNKWF